MKQLDQSVFKEWADCWKFLAIDEDGDAWRYREKPEIDSSDKRWLPSNTVPLLIGKGYDASNWQNSLIERDSKELSGSDLTRKILADSTDMVNCYISDDSDYDALNDKDERTIMGFSDGWFHTNSVASWKYAVPINNQGEPLTAAEVGL